MGRHFPSLVHRTVSPLLLIKMTFDFLPVAVALSAVTILACILTFTTKRLVVLRKSLKSSQLTSKSTISKDNGPNKDRVWGSICPCIFD